MTSYDQVLYPSLPFQQTHPSRIAAIARLHGIPAASPERCRVLELGCGNGGNLIPIAAAYPNSEFVGIDLAQTAIDTARKTADEMRLQNLTLMAADISAFDDSLGTFDYISAHGVFSWVPEPVRQAILNLCQALLKPQGIAYISYNALPGCHVRKIYWDILKFHTHAIDDSSAKIKQAKAMLQFLAEGMLVKGPLGDYLKSEARHIAQERHESVLFHDDLSSSNTPFYFHEFAARLESHGLQFLSEADYSDMEMRIFPPKIAQHLIQLGEVGIIPQQQYRDFLTMRRFRQTLVVRDSVSILWPGDLMAIKDFSIGMEKRAKAEPPDLSPGVQVRFSQESGCAVTTDHPFAKAVLMELLETWPHPIAFEELTRRATVRLEGKPRDPTDKEVQVGMEVLHAAFTTGLALFFVDPPRTVAQAGDKPKLWSQARQQIERGQLHLTNRLHLPVKIEDAITQRLLWCMDGTRDRTAIIEELVRWSIEQTRLQGSGEFIIDADQLREKFTQEIDVGYQKAAELVLLEPESTK